LRPKVPAGKEHSLRGTPKLTMDATKKLTSCRFDRMENLVNTSWNQHYLVLVGPRACGQCVSCLKAGRKNLKKVKTFCITCPGGAWMCFSCFNIIHGTEKAENSSPSKLIKEGFIYIN